MTQCVYVSRLTAARCEREAFAPGESYCVRHDIAQSFRLSRQILLEGFRAYGEPAIELGILDMNVVVGQYMNMNDEQIAAMLKRKYEGDQTYLIPWVRELIDSSMPTKNDTPL